jgi:glucose-6-phosphate isomerase
MAATSNNDLYQAIGRLTATVEGLRRDIDASERRAGAENREADEKRAIVHRRMDEIISEVGDIKTDIATIRDDVTDAKAVTDDVKKWKLMGIGALGVVGIGGTALGVSLASSFEWIARLFQR